MLEGTRALEQLQGSHRAAQRELWSRRHRRGFEASDEPHVSTGRPRAPWQAKEPGSEASSPEQETLFLRDDGNSCSPPNATRQAQDLPQPSSSFSCKSLCRYRDLLRRRRSARFK